MTQSFRSKSIKALKEGKAEILVATDIAARGLDIPDISHVVNYELPLVLDEFVHRCGRTGRIGRAGTSVTLVTGREKIFSVGLPWLSKRCVRLFQVSSGKNKANDNLTRTDLAYKMTVLLHTPAPKSISELQGIVCIAWRTTSERLWNS